MIEEKDSTLEELQEAIQHPSKEAMAQMFASEYEMLCARHGMRIIGVPKLVGTNHGTFEIGVDLQVVEVQNQNSFNKFGG